jgi:hypothetical protein
MFPVSRSMRWNPSLYGYRERESLRIIASRTCGYAGCAVLHTERANKAHKSRGVIASLGRLRSESTEHRLRASRQTLT